ncbi:MAG: hypothetical protein R3E87_05855 [Burkholderiaceae bacterium]
MLRIKGPGALTPEQTSQCPAKCRAFFWSGRALSIPLPSFPIWLAVHREIRRDRAIRIVFDHLGRELAPCL